MQLPSSTSATMNDNTNFNFSNNGATDNGGAAAAASAPYCQTIPVHQHQGGGAPAPSPQVNGNNLDQQDLQQQTLGIQNNINTLQSLLQGQGGHQFPQDQFQGNDVVPNQNASAAGAGTCWQSCRFCQQKFFVTSERLLEHEISCPMHLQVQQFLQQQQQQGQIQGGGGGGDLVLQQQLQMQQNQLQQQFAQQQNQFDAGVGSMFGQAGGLGQLNQFMGGGNFGHQMDHQVQNQDLTSLLQQQQQQSANEQQQQAFQHQGQSEDQFESAIDRLPAFDNNNQQVAAHQASSAAPAAPLPQPKPLTCSSPGSATDYFPLAMPEDEEWLTPLHCFVRKYCVEVFVATAEDVAAPCMGKRNPVSVSQVGIRCPYCSPERMGSSDQVDVARARENGVVYPSLISRIYNSSINLLQRHLRSCAFVPPEILARYEELKSSNARSGASKKYWADSATRLGLLDTPDGIRLDEEIHRAHRASSQSADGQAAGRKGSKDAASALQGSDSQAPPLVLPSDKRNTTAFTFHLMSQMQPCVFTEADRLGRRRGLDVGFAGLACRHCFGVYGSGRFFPSSVKTMADASKTLDVIYRHVMKCKNCPCDIKGGLRNLRDFHDSERSKMPFGNQRAFFVKIWGRLHEGSADLAVQAQAGAMPSLPQAMPPATDQQQQQPDMMAPIAATATASNVPSMGVKLEAGSASSIDSVHGLYAMVKRGSNQESDHNKLVTEAA